MEVRPPMVFKEWLRINHKLSVDDKEFLDNQEMYVQSHRAYCDNHYYHYLYNTDVEETNTEVTASLKVSDFERGMLAGVVLAIIIFVCSIKF